MKRFLTNIKNKTPQAIAPTLIAGIIFLITYFCFGAANSMIGPFVTLAYINFRNMKDNLGCMIRHFAIFTVMACAAYIAVMNAVLCMIVNAIMLFWIAYLLINEYQPSNYFPSGMALIFFQISPALTPSELLTRLLALAVSFVIIFMFVWFTIITHKKKEPLLELIEQGFDVCGRILDILGVSPRREEPSQPTLPALTSQPAATSQPALTQLQQRLREINHSIAMEIYSYNRSSLKRRGAVNWFCRFLLFFQSFDFMTAEATSSVENQHRTLGAEASASAENLCRTPDAEARVSIEKAADLYEKFRDKFRNDTPAADYKKLILRDNRPDIRSFRFRFALRMVVVMTPVLTICLMSSLQNVYWLAISVFFMMIPFSNETMRRVRERVVGSIIGILICFALFSLFPGLPAHIVIMMIANFFIYTASSYTTTVAYITCSALAVQTAEAFAVTALEQRLLYTLLGALIAILANRFIFPIRMDRQIEYIRELLARIRSQLTALNDSSMPAEIYVTFGIRRKTDEQLDVACLAHQSDQLIVKSYLLSGRIRQLNQAMPEEKRDPDLPHLEQEHMRFMSDYLAKYL